jgi:hypothetical protein
VDHDFQLLSHDNGRRVPQMTALVLAFNVLIADYSGRTQRDPE